MNQTNEKTADIIQKQKKIQFKLLPKEGNYYLVKSQGKNNYYYYFKTNVYTKNDMKIKIFNKTKIEKKNIWNWKKLKEEEYYKIVLYEY